MLGYPNQIISLNIWIFSFACVSLTVRETKIDVKHIVIVVPLLTAIEINLVEL